MNYYFPIHVDGGNRGCEGIAKGTAIILNQPKERLKGYCTNVELDERLGVSDFVSLYKPATKLPLAKKTMMRFKKLLSRDKYSKELIDTSYKYEGFFPEKGSNDIMVSTGGDMLCYANHLVCATESIAHKRGMKTILWGCSMGEKNLDPIKEKALKEFDLIYARETLTYDFFKSLGLKNVVCLPDPAFVLTPEKTELPTCFSKGKVVGINLSNYTVGADNLNTRFGKEVRKLMDYIIHKTDYQILLIPHVLWKNQDDRLIANEILNEYQGTPDRIAVLESERLNYLQIRYVISQCHSFIGARTHATISAYSTCVPSIALGYSIKSKGIAKDLGLSEKLVVDTVNYQNGALLNSFLYLVNNNHDIKSHLENIMPEYCEKPFEIRQYLQ